MRRGACAEAGPSASAAPAAAVRKARRLGPCATQQARRRPPARPVALLGEGVADRLRAYLRGGRRHLGGPGGGGLRLIATHELAAGQAAGVVVELELFADHAVERAEQDRAVARLRKAAGLREAIRARRAETGRRPGAGEADREAEAEDHESRDSEAGIARALAQHPVLRLLAPLRQQILLTPPIGQRCAGCSGHLRQLPQGRPAKLARPYAAGSVKT